MIAPALPPNPSLVAIILIARTRKGVKRVFHYPPNPGKGKSHAKVDYEESSAEENSSSSDSDYSSVEDDPGNDSVSERIPHNGLTELDESGSVSPEKDSNEHTWKLHGERNQRTLLDLPYGFERLLCPSPAFHKKRFEMSIGGLTFVGWPVFARENGEWRRRRKSKGVREATKKMTTISEQELAGMSRRASVQIDELLADNTRADSTEDEPETPFEDELYKIPSGMIPMQEDDEFEDSNDRSRQDLSMFHVVFVMNPPPLEYQLRVDEMYKYVVKKLSRALKWEQARSNYVQKECDKLKSLKAKHESSSENAIRNSNLARAIAVVFSSISTSRIARVELDPHHTFPLQIPIPTSISQLPDLISPQLPGLWLTTSTSIPSNEDLHTTRTRLASHFALLLLSDLSTILADIASTSSPLTAPLTNYLRHSTPRKSFLQVSQLSGIPLADIHYLASELIYWRRARAVPPLHQRDIYIVSPNADMRKLRSATQQYAKLFPAQLPSLPKMLSLLSAGPRPFNTLIPSKDHKPVYFDVLAWLLRGGWVTQLRTFAWVRVPPAIQAAVAREEADVAAEAQSREQHGEKEFEKDEFSSTYNSPANDNPQELEIAPTNQQPSTSGTSTPSSHSSTQTAIPVDQSEILQKHEVRVNPGSVAPIEAFTPMLMLQPTKASGRESRYLAHIARAMEVSEGSDVRDCWERCLKYFNGEHALEKIAAREGWKRKRLEVLRQTWSRLGVLLESRHW